MKKINFRKGAATFLEFTITATFLTFIVLLIVSLYIKRQTIQKIDLYTDQIARDIVTCTSLEEAQEIAEKKKEEYFSKISHIDISNIQVSVGYAIGSPEEWRRGNYITVIVYGKIKPTLSIGETKYSTRVLKMIEHN